LRLACCTHLLLLCTPGVDGLAARLIETIRFSKPLIVRDHIRLTLPEQCLAAVGAAMV
jgi:hypothetical protein